MSEPTGAISEFIWKIVTELFKKISLVLPDTITWLGKNTRNITAVSLSSIPVFLLTAYYFTLTQKQFFVAIQDGAKAGWPNLAPFRMRQTIGSPDDYDQSDGSFIARQDGYYVFSFTVAAVPLKNGAFNDITIIKSDSSGKHLSSDFPAIPACTPATAGNWCTWTYSSITKMRSGDKVQLYHSCCADSVEAEEWRGSFSGYFLHP